MTTPHRDTILEELQPIFREALDEPGLVITLASNATNTPNWDSLANISLVLMVESYFKIRIALNELDEMQEVRDLVDLIAAKTANS